jgi:hypothetical protein
LVNQGVVEERKCTDIVCLIVFIVLALTFAVFTVYFLVRGGLNYSSLSSTNTVINAKADFGATFAKVPGIIIGMVVLSFAFSIIYVLLCAKFPKIVVYTSIIVTFLAYLALIILGIMMQQWLVVVLSIIGALLNACILYCFR